MLDQQAVKEVLDAEWVELMKIAKSLDLSVEEIREFLIANKTESAV
ncbi:DNA-binding anti-repressor SinI [Domibacillus robiginosus]|nr:DNA-binding anti-repressor SinI [Domibacillus robiginosus]